MPAAKSAGPRFGSLYRTLALSVALPLIVVQVLLHQGISAVIALAAGTVFPLLEMLIEALQTKRVGIIAVVSLAGIATGFALAFVTGNAVFALLKDSAFTFVFGLIFLGSLFSARPLIFRLSLDMAGNDAAARAAGEALWEKPAARATFRLMTLVWGLGLMAEAAARVVAAFTLPIATAAAVSPLISLVAFGGLIAWTVALRKARTSAGLRNATR